MKNYQISSFVFSLPESLQEVSFVQYLQIVTLNEHSALNILSLIVPNAEQLQQLTPGQLSELYEKVRFFDDGLQLLGASVPDQIAGINAPDDIHLKPIYQYVAIGDWTKEFITGGTEDTMFAAFLPLVCVYLTERDSSDQTAYLDHAKAKVDQIGQLPCTEAVPLAFSLWQQITNLKRSGRLISYRVNDSPTKTRAAMAGGWLRSRLRSIKSRLRIGQAA